MTRPPCFDEMRSPDGAARPAYARLARWLEELPPDRLRQVRTIGGVRVQVDVDPYSFM